MKIEKTESKYKINLRYDSKLKDDNTGWKTRIKMHNLTWSHSRIDPIDHWVKSFSFRNFEDIIWHSRGDFSLVFQQNLDFKHFLDAEMSLEEEEIKRIKDWDF